MRRTYVQHKAVAGLERGHVLCGQGAGQGVGEEGEGFNDPTSEGSNERRRPTRAPATKRGLADEARYDRMQYKYVEAVRQSDAPAAGVSRAQMRGRGPRTR